MEWSFVKLGDVCKIEKEQFREGELPYVGLEDIEGFTGCFLGDLNPRVVASSTFRFTSQHVLYGRLRPYLNKVLVPDFGGHCSSEIFPLKPTSQLDRKYLYYWLSSDSIVSAINATCTGARMPRANVNTVLTFEIPLPTISEQKRLVAILDEVFADIEQVRAKTEQNLKNARELFESYLQQVFSQRGKGWVEYKMSEVCTITSKLIDPKDSEYLDLPHVGAGNMVSGSGELVDVKTAREEGLISGKFPFDSTMVLYSKIRPNLMKVCRPDFSGLCSADVYPLVPIDGLLDKDYLFYLLLSQDFTEYAVSGSGRAGMPKVNRTHLFNYLLSVPSIESQREYVVKMDQILEYSQTLESVYSLKLKSLDELKKSILQKAFSGELTKTSDNKTKQGALA